jgi:hypothetical protein
MKASTGVRAWGHFLLLLGPLLSGCFPLLYAYPSLSFVPPFQAGPVDEKIYAFRVDITDERNGAEFPDQDRYVVREIPVSETARVPLQAKLDLDRGWVFYGRQKYSAHTHHAVIVRLYRPGYQTVEIAMPGDAKKVCWVEEPDPLAREKAVDDLLSTWRTDSSGQAEHDRKFRSGEGTPNPPVDATIFRRLAPGSIKAEHQRFLWFAADEYERIASLACPCAERLMAKANWLRKRASE